MASVHGKNTYVSLGGDDLSAFTNSVDFGREADSHDTTTFGKNSKTYSGGLLDGTATLQGIYDSDATSGPSAVIVPLLGTTAELIYRPEGVGTGKPETTVTALVTGYSQSSPVADMVTWQADLQFSGDVETTVQA